MYRSRYLADAAARTSRLRFSCSLLGVGLGDLELTKGLQCQQR
jgi:hypothetical protein